MKADWGNRDILFVCSSLSVGGTERQLAAIAGGLIEHGWRVAVYSLAGPGEMQPVLERAGVSVVLPPVKRPPNRLSKLWRSLVLAGIAPHLAFTMLRRRPGIVHFMLPEAYLVGAPIAALARIPVRVMSRRSLNLYQTGRVVRWAESRLHRSMDAVLGNSAKVIGELKAEGVSSARLSLIYNGIDAAAFDQRSSRTERRIALGVPEDALVIAMVANLIPYKGHGDLLNALSRVSGRLPVGWRLLLVGRDDGIGPQLREQANRGGIGENVSFLGSRTDVADILAASDISVLSSHQEGFPNAILEAMASRLPVVATDVGGNAEAVIDGVTGLIVPPHDPERLAAAILNLAKDPVTRRNYGEAGHQRVVDNFAMERCVAAHDALYRALLASSPRTR